MANRAMGPGYLSALNWATNPSPKRSAPVVWKMSIAPATSTSIVMLP
jgi:hypothetical protein